MAIWSRLTGALAGIAIGRAAGPAIDPVFEVTRQRSWGERAVRVLDPATAARADARGVDSAVDYADDAKRQGIGAARFDVMRRLSLSGATREELLELRRRELIDDDDLEAGLQHALVLPYWRQQIQKLRWIVPSVTDMVRFAVREVYNPAQREALNLDAEFPPAFANDAANLGIDRERAGQYWAAHWELPSYTQLTDMRFRGLLSPQEYRDALKAIDYAPVWRDKLFAIARRIPTIPDMVRFAVREVYNPELRQSLGYEAEYPEAFTEQAALHGLSEAHARQYWWAHWRLPSARQGYQMVWRGEMEQAELRNLLKALDYPAVWRERLFNIAFIVPGRIDLKRMLRHGILDRDGVKRGYQRIGYHPDNAELMTQIAEAEVGTGTGASPFVLTAQRRLYTVAHTEYLDESIDEAIARRKLAALQVPADQQTTIITLWNEEAEIRRRELTPAQIRKAYRSALLTEVDALDRLQDAGMTPDDASVFLASG